jgi:hypothetical protein
MHFLEIFCARKSFFSLRFALPPAEVEGLFLLPAAVAVDHSLLRGAARALSSQSMDNCPNR